MSCYVRALPWRSPSWVSCSACLWCGLLNQPLRRKYGPWPFISPTNRLHGNHECFACISHLRAGETSFLLGLACQLLMSVGICEGSHGVHPTPEGDAMNARPIPS